MRRAEDELEADATPGAGGAARASTLPGAEAKGARPAAPEPIPLRGRALYLLSLGALGVVYGDIGTSPLYAVRECFSAEHGVPPTRDNVLGVLSLIVWALTLVVSVKYILFILRADNRGEGGILALLALVSRPSPSAQKRAAAGGAVLVALGLFGAALLYGDGVITPAISVLGAMEGLEVAAPAFAHLVVPATLVVLVLLFLVQRHGTARVGVVFGPFMLLWFAAIAALGVVAIVHAPEILLALAPWYAVRFFLQHGVAGFTILGSVVLVVTGGEALYADMGHFGRAPIRTAWFAVVMPSLLLNYFGQGALLLRSPAAAANPFYRLAPEALLYPLLLIATAAAVIASQALISGVFSLTRQAVQLGFSPRMTIVHTSAETEGQIFMPEVNVALMLGCLALVLSFRSSSGLAAAYGVAVTGTMVITTLLYHRVARQRFGWSAGRAAAFLAVFLVIDLAFFLSNVGKIAHGGLFPVVVAAVVYVMMTTWRRGRSALREILQNASLPMELFLHDVDRRTPARVRGTAVFMTSEAGGAPVVLLHHLKHNQVLHETVLLLSIRSADVPAVPAASRVTIEPLSSGFHRVQAVYGFAESPSVPEIMQRCRAAGINAPPMDTTFYLGREHLIPRGRTGMSRWRRALFAFMSRNARGATEFFDIPPRRVVELGAQIEI
ncbi:MAG TPA: potassium transporter Kup [Gemmatimonadaceae bacterium]|nr:potassium transporter Kup [Gemmatimonadaceae bacterium]